MYTKWLNVLSISPLFQGVSAEALEVMLNCLQPKISRYQKHSYLTVAGEKFTGVGILLSGEAAVIKENAAGNRVMMALLKQGDMFGEMAAFSDKRIWPASVFAQVDCTAMFLPPEKIIGECQNVCHSHKLLIQNMLRIVSTKALLLNRKVEYLTIKSIRGKISRYLLEHHKLSGNDTFMLPLKRNELADFLNVSRVALSREMCRMRDEGMIEFHRSSIKIKELGCLKQMLE